MTTWNVNINGQDVPTDFKSVTPVVGGTFKYEGSDVTYRVTSVTTRGRHCVVEVVPPATKTQYTNHRRYGCHNDGDGPGGVGGGEG